MKKIAIGVCFLLMFFGVQAQEKWTLRQCIDHAIENNIEIKQQEIQVQNSEINLSTSKNSRLPNLNASVGQNFSFGRSISTSTNSATSANVGTTDFNISSSAPLFTGFRITNEIKRDELNLLATIEGLKKAKENMELQVARYYLDVLFKKEKLKVYQEQEELTAKQVARTDQLVEAGKVPMSQLYDIKAQLAKDELNIVTAQNDLDLTILDLSQVLNLESTVDFDVAEPSLDNVLVNNMSSILPQDQIYEMALGIKPHVREAEYNVESKEKTLKIAKSGYLPKLDLNLRYGTGFDHVYGSKVVNANKHDQLIRNQGKTIGFTLSIPIFNRFQVRNQVRAAHLDIANQRLVLDNVKLSLYKEIQQANQSAIAAQSKYISTEKAYGAASESYKYAEERYAIGKSTVFELNESQTKLLSSKSEQLQAKYDFLFCAKILDFYRGEPIDINY